MKHTLANFPKLFKPQGKVAVPIIDLKDSLEVFNLIREVDEWKTCFEKEQQEAFERNIKELKILTELHSNEAKSKRYFIQGWQFAIKELLGKDKP